MNDPLLNPGKGLELTPDSTVAQKAKYRVIILSVENAASRFPKTRRIIFH